MSSFEKVRTANILHNERRQAWTEIKTDYRAAILFKYVGLAQRCQINQSSPTLTRLQGMFTVCPCKAHFIFVKIKCFL